MASKTKLMSLGTKTLDRLIDLIFKLTAESFDMALFPSRHAGPRDKLIRVQDFCVARKQRYVAARDSIKSVLEASKKAIQESIEKLKIHEKLMRKFLDMHEQATISLKGSGEDKHHMDRSTICPRRAWRSSSPT